MYWISKSLHDLQVASCIQPMTVTSAQDR